jgi:hypothetical protein
MTLAAKHTYTPETPLGFINDDLLQLYGELNTPTLPPASHTHVEADITDLGDYATSTELTTALADYTTTAAKKLWVPSQSFDIDAGIALPATLAASIGSSRLSAWLTPTGSTNIYHWSNLAIPAEWATGDKIKSTIYYALDTAGGAGEEVAWICAGFGYDVGDGFTSPTVNWNETAYSDVSSLTNATIYSQVLTETSATIANDFISIRVTLKRADARYDYPGGVYFFGVLLEVV